MKKAFLAAVIVFILCASAACACPCSQTNAQNDAKKITSEIEQSINSTAEIQERISRRGLFMRMFFGGDLEAGKDLQKIADENNARLIQLKQVREGCGNCSAADKKRIDELESAVQKIEMTAIMEKNLKGLFGWFRK